jgi:hypothetical protein
MWKDARDTRVAEQERVRGAEAQEASRAQSTADTIARMKYEEDNHFDRGMEPEPGHGRSR